LRLDARPVFATAQETKEASLHAQCAWIDEADAGGISVAVLRVVDLAFPFICFGLLPVPVTRLAWRHAKQDGHPQCRAGAKIGIRIFGVYARFCFPGHDTPQTAVAIGDFDARDLLGDHPFSGWIRRGSLSGLGSGTLNCLRQGAAACDEPGRKNRA